MVILSLSKDSLAKIYSSTFESFLKKAFSGLKWKCFPNTDTSMQIIVMSLSRERMTDEVLWVWDDIEETPEKWYSE